jgi:hypothetical protein
MCSYPLGLHEVEAPRISKQSAQYGGKVVSPTHRPAAFTLPEDIAGTHFCYWLSGPRDHSAAGRMNPVKKSL